MAGAGHNRIVVVRQLGCCRVGGCARSVAAVRDAVGHAGFAGHAGIVGQQATQIAVGGDHGAARYRAGGCTGLAVRTAAATGSQQAGTEHQGAQRKTARQGAGWLTQGERGGDAASAGCDVQAGDGVQAGGGVARRDVCRSGGCLRVQREVLHDPAWACRWAARRAGAGHR